MPSLSSKFSDLLSGMLSGNQNGKPDIASLVAAGSGTAMASVCAIGLLQIQQLSGGLWSVISIIIAALLCLYLARIFSRLSEVVPSGAGLIAFLSRGFNPQIGIAVVVPYLFLMLFLVGFESLIVGTLLERITGMPVLPTAIAFIFLTWAICRAGIRTGYSVQILTTAALFLSLSGLSILAILSAIDQGRLLESVLPPAPSFNNFVAAIGQAMFLFLGFELLTSHIEVAKPGAVKKALPLSVGVLFLFYCLMALGFACMVMQPITEPGLLFIPQLAIAEQMGGVIAVTVVAIICTLASFTSFNGALLALSRFIYALAVQGKLPRRLAIVDRRSMTANAALNALLVAALACTLVMYFLELFDLVILAAAVTASWVYFSSALVYSRHPFAQSNKVAAVWPAWCIAAVLLILGIGVIVDSQSKKVDLIILLCCFYAVGLVMATRTTKKQKSRREQNTTLARAQVPTAGGHEPL